MEPKPDKKLKSLRKRYEGHRINARQWLTDALALYIEDHHVMISDISYVAERQGYVRVSVACHSHLIGLKGVHEWLLRIVEVIAHYYNLKVVCKYFHYDQMRHLYPQPSTTDLTLAFRSTLQSTQGKIDPNTTTLDSSTGITYNSQYESKKDSTANAPQEQRRLLPAPKDK